MTPWTFPVVDFTADPRRLLPVFQISPNWKSGVTETLAWMTDVMSSEKAVEQRRSLRRFPRRFFEYSFLRADAARSRIDNFLAGVAKRDHLVPIWHEQFTLKNTPNDLGMVQFPAGSLGQREFALDDLVMITNMDMDRYAVLTVTGYDAGLDQIVLSAGADAGAWLKGSRIVPLRRAKVLDNATLENVSDHVATVRIRWMLQDADGRFTPSWGHCSPLWSVRPDRATPITMEYNRSDFVNDFNTGVIDVSDPGDRAQISQSMKLMIFGRPNVWAFRAFLYSARGRARRFFVPTFMNDIEPLTDLGGTAFEAKANGFSEYYAGPQEARQIMGIDFKDGRPSLYRTIIGVTPAPGGVPPHRPVAEIFLLSEALPEILRSDIEKINFVVPSRFDQDTIDLFHATADCMAVGTSVVVKSSVIDGMPPIEC